MFDRYSEKARRAIFFARYECSNYGSPNIESEHLLLGLLRETALLQRLLKTGRESLKVLREEIEHQITRRAPVATNVDLPLTAECERILSFATEESKRRGQVQPEHLLLGPWQVEPEHLLLGLLREEQCLGARILQAHEVTFSRVLEEVTHGRRGGEEKVVVGTLRGAEWCCADFQARCYQAGKKEDGLGILFFTQSRAGTYFLLEYRRPDRMPSEPIAACGIRLKMPPGTANAAACEAVH
jgi:hypothetical protein